MRIGIFGGSFDPPHIGHMKVAEAAAEHLALDEVLFVPAQRNPLKTKSTEASARQRLEMVTLAMETHPKFAVSDQEIRRGGKSYAIETLEELHAVQEADFWLILGVDAAARFDEWKKPERIVRIARIALVVRDADSPEEAIARVPEQFQAFVDLVPMKRIDVSSTAIRDRINRGQPVSNWLAPAVFQYIQKNKLYI